MLDPNSEQEGVIKYQLHHTPMLLGITPQQLAELNSRRLLMYRLQLIGQDEQRYDGLAFGNLSQRLAKGSEQFLISGTQTGDKEVLAASDFSLVTSVQPDMNTLYAQGEAKPSSEALTHASVYQQNPSAQAIIHIHSPEIWQCTAALNFAHTPADVAYGTPDMALAVAELFHTRTLQQSGLFTMLGHTDGVVAFGESLEIAAGLIIKAWVRAERELLSAGQVEFEHKKIS